MPISTQSSQGEHVVNKIDENEFRRNPIPFFVLASVLVHLIGLVFFTVIERSQSTVQLVPDTAPIDFVVVPPEESTASKVSELPPQEENLPHQVVEPVAPSPQPAIAEKAVIPPETRSPTVVVPEPIVESLPKETKLPEKIKVDSPVKPEIAESNILRESQNSPEILSGSDPIVEKTATPESPIEVNEPENSSVATRLPNNALPTEQPTKVPNASPKKTSTTGAASLLGGNLQKSFADDGGSSFFNPENNLGQQAYNPELDAKQRLDMRNYFSEIKRRVRRNWNPRYSTKEQNTILSFSIQRNGQITALQIRQTSGSQSVDREALNAVQNAVPFEPLPENFPLEMLKVEFNFNIYIY